MRLDELDYARVMPLTCLFPSAATMFPAEMSEARIAAAKTNILATIVDDLFDVRESREEMENLVALIEMHVLQIATPHPSLADASLLPEF
jgi:hypothetical protein